MKIHYHSDCSFFAGCENILSNLLNNRLILLHYEVSYSFPSFSYYISGADKRIKSDIQRFPLYLPDVSKLNYYLSHKKINKHLKNIIVAPVYFLDRSYIFMLYDIILLFLLFKKIKPDILHINNGGYPAAVSCRAAVIAAKYASVGKIVFHVNNIAEDKTKYNLLKRIVENKLDKFVKDHVDLFITGSNFARLKLVDRGFAPHQIVSIPNTIIPRKIIETPESIRRRLKLSNEDLIFGNVAILTNRKGHTVLINSFALLRDKVSDFSKVKLIIEGTGEDEQKLKNLVDKLRLNNNVLLIGTQDNIFDIYNMFDVFVLSSICNEDMPNVIIEAMSLGKPVIGTNLAGIPEEIENNMNGFIVRISDANELAEAMFKFIIDRNLIQKMGLKSKEIFEYRFAYPIIVNRFIKLYEALCMDKS